MYRMFIVIGFFFSLTALSQDKSCATRVSIALTGESPNQSRLDAKKPKDDVANILGSSEFIENFSRFVNATYNASPGESLEEDVVYFFSKHVLENNLPWADMFIGKLDLKIEGEGENKTISVVPNERSHGYFSTQSWMNRYAGNEEEGLRIVAAYQILNNSLGLNLDAITNSPDTDTSSTGRQAAACRGCHYDGWYALDKVADILSRVQRNSDEITYIPSDDTPKKVLGDQSITNEKDLLDTIVSSDHYLFATCRLATKFVYGRSENQCETEVFDACIQALRSEGRIQDGIAKIVQHPSFCK